MRKTRPVAILILQVEIGLLASCGGGAISAPTQPSGATITSVAVTPTSATIGSQVQFVATVSGTGSYSTAVTWSLAAGSGSTLSPGTLSSTGLYTTPYPAPPTVVVTASSIEDPSVSGTATVTLNPPAATAGPLLTVDAGNQTHAISRWIYGMDAYLLNATDADAAAVAKTGITIDRWGGDSTERYNYQLDVTNDIADWYFENETGSSGDGWQTAPNGESAFNHLVETNNSETITTLGTVPVNGWVSKDASSCSYPISTYPDQVSVDSTRGCGNGFYAQGSNGCTTSSGCPITGNNPTVTSINEPAPTPPAASRVNEQWAAGTWAGKWVSYLVGKFGPGNPATGTSKGVAVYDLDNEPSWWDANDMDVHPLPFTYDEVTTGGIGSALAIKTADPTALVGGPVMDYWWDYFYSKKDVEAGWNDGPPCYEPWSDPIDRKAHHGVPFIQYYLQQFAQAQQTYGIRLLDYVDLHTYFAATYNSNSVAFTTAGDTGEQQARMNSTRAFWDPTYTDPNYTQPNYITDPGYTANCTVPLQAPQLIPMMKSWVANSYPGTKLAITEYNWGGMESINGAVTEADILGIFGREGLDIGTYWPTTNPSQQIPGMMAFAMYRNYDGNHSVFGDTALNSTSTASGGADGEGLLAVYGALRTADNAVTVMVINKTYGGLTETLQLKSVKATGPAQVYLFSGANLGAIAPQASIPVTGPASGSSTSTLSTSFPAQSITLLVIPQN